MNREEVHIFEQQPAPWTQGIDHPTYRELRFWKMMQQPACVHEIKTASRQLIDFNIVRYGLQIGEIYIFEQLDVDVGRNDATGWPDLLAQPRCHRTASSSNLQTS